MAMFYSPLKGRKFGAKYGGRAASWTRTLDTISIQLMTHDVNESIHSYGSAYMGILFSLTQSRLP